MSHRRLRSATLLLAAALVALGCARFERFHRHRTAAPKPPPAAAGPQGEAGRVVHPKAQVAPGAKVKPAHTSRFARLRFWRRKAPEQAAEGGARGKAPLRAAVESLGAAGGPGLGVRVVRDAAPCTPLLA
ncbi:MAG: hypothetical protein D6739_00600, partial [Nitrospirae bacterium]